MVVIMLTANNIRASYRNTTILDNINLNIYQGEFAGIIGPKVPVATLLKVISGVKKPLAEQFIWIIAT